MSASPGGGVDVIFLNDVHAAGFCEEFYGDSVRLGPYLAWVASLRAALAPRGHIIVLENGTEGSLGLEGTIRFLRKGGLESRKVIPRREGFLIDLQASAKPLASPGPGGP